MTAVATKSTPRLRPINPVIWQALESGIITEPVLSYIEMYVENRQAQLDSHGILKDPSVLKRDAERMVGAGKKHKNSRVTLLGEKLFQMAGQFKASEPAPTSHSKDVSMKSLIKSVEQDLKKGIQSSTVIRKRGKRKQVA